MSLWNAFYVRNCDASTITTMQNQFSLVNVDLGEDFLGITLADSAFEPPMNKLAALSADLDTEVIWLSFQSVVDAFEFHHWQAGKLLRSLVFGCYEEERTWEHVVGEPEPWEREAFFDPNRLRYASKFVNTAREKHQLEQIWSEAKILRGETEPGIDALEAARTVAKYYGFPGWGWHEQED